MSKNPYEILGINKDATDADIKSAYRKLAKKFHPDLNPGNKEADAKFKELNSANDLLNDKEKRAAYDRGQIDMEGQPRQQQRQQRTYRDYAEGPQGSRYHTGGGDFDLSDLESIFSGFGMGSGRGGKNPFENFQQPSRDVHYKIDVDFLEAARGAKKRVTMPDGKTLDILIPEGIEEGQQLRLKGKGPSSSSSKQPGDAYVEVHIKPHAFFTRKSKDITIELPVALQESVLGGKIQVPTIHGAVEMNIPKGFGSGNMMRLKGKGINGGDQYVKLVLVMPKIIDTDLEQAISKWSQTHSYNPRKEWEAAI